MDGNQTNNSSNGTGPVMVPRGSPFTAEQILAVKIALIIISVLAVVGNATVVYLVTTKRRLRTKTNAMVVSLAVSDLVVGLFLIPSFFACMYVKCDNQLSKLFYDVFLFTSVLNLCCITADRFLAITRPLKYHMKMTKRTVSVMICLSWVIPAIVQLIPATWYYTDTNMEDVKLNNKIFYTIQVVVFTFIPCLIMLVGYLVIFKIAWKQSRHLRHMVSNLNLSNDSSLGQKSGPPPSITSEARATLKVFGTVLLVFIFCWCLSAFRSIVVNYDLLVLNAHLVMTSRMLLVSNSAINPIIYAFWKKDMKMELRKLFRLSGRSVRPTSGTFRSSHDFSNGHLGRKPSSLGSKQDLSLSERRTPNKVLDESRIANVVMADRAITEIKENDATETQQESDPTTIPKDGIDNLAIEIDGMV